MAGTDAFDVMLRRQFRDPNGSRPAVFTRQGGSGQDIRVRFANADGAAAFEGTGAITARPIAQILQADVPGRPLPKDTLAIDGRPPLSCVNVTGDAAGKLWQVPLANG